MEERKKAVFYPNVVGFGDSLGVIIPKDIVNLINLKKKDKLEMTFEVLERYKENVEENDTKQ